MLYAIHALILLAVLGLRYRQIDGRISPDGQYYLNLSVGRRVPKPYHARVLLPLATRGVVAATGWSPHTVMRTIVVGGVLFCLASVYLLTLHLGGSPWMALVATLAVVMTDSVGGSWVMFVWLCDSWSYGFALLAVTCDPITAAVFLAFAAATKEAGYAAGYAVAVLLGSPWWVGLPGLGVWLLLYALMPKAPPDTEEIKNPVRYAQINKRRIWFDWQKNLSHLRASPYLAVLFLPSTPYAAPALVVSGLAWLQCHIATDHARLIGPAFCFICPMVAVSIDPQFLGAWALIQTFWPVRATEYA